ncbi:hypothetical protein G7054_g14732 [Neopestalotiopsis clavispora]|nr:hypothetical protein G7054_g14732 [Neopestalotiopsis clavispora]
MAELPLPTDTEQIKDPNQEKDVIGMAAANWKAEYQEAFKKVVTAESEAAELAVQVDNGATELERLRQSHRVSQIEKASLKLKVIDFQSAATQHEIDMQDKQQGINELNNEIDEYEAQRQIVRDRLQRYFADMVGVQGLQTQLWGCFMDAIEYDEYKPAIRHVHACPWAVMRPWLDADQPPLTNREAPGLMESLTQLYYHIANDNPEVDMFPLLHSIALEGTKKYASGVFVGVISLIFKAAHDRFAQKRWGSIKPQHVESIQGHLVTKEWWRVLGQRLFSNIIAHFTTASESITLHKNTHTCLMGSEYFIILLDIREQTVRMVERRRVTKSIRDMTTRVAAPNVEDDITLVMKPENAKWWMRWTRTEE